MKTSRQMKRALILMSCLVGMSMIQAQNTLFTLLKSKDTGIDFKNEIVDTKEHNILIYSNYYGGAGVGVGDFNRDGRDDLAAIVSGSSEVAIYLANTNNGFALSPNPTARMNA